MEYIYLKMLIWKDKLLLRFNFKYIFIKLCTLVLLLLNRKDTNMTLWCYFRFIIKGEGWSTANRFKPPVILLLAVPRRLFCFGSMVVLDVVYGYVLLFLLDIKIENR